VSRLEQTLNKPIVVLVVGVIAVALNVLLYFGLFLPRMTPLITHINPIGTSLPEAIRMSDPEASSNTHPEDGSKSDSESSTSGPEVSSKSGSESRSNSGSEGSLASETDPPPADSPPTNSPSGSPPELPPLPTAPEVQYQ
jgi:hypothetical protein